ncbi:transcription factor bHLH18-like isoform X1 [Nicotiana sylvestris]|uniref:Transcription factor bHLH18 n=2 Tax=Nicotiana TaxID=4085 RepID=A0A1S4AV82_TOBAC|nr:PREDICTED: transcription factor bHLH18-like [Nicotiana sylvestris]XP_016480480.1 PREDICTED: transcription factor bHLH18-like [Nicotiana tabacum]
MDNSSLRWFSRTGEAGAYYSNEKKSVDDFTTQKSTISEDGEIREVSLSPDRDSRHAYSRSNYFNQENKSKVAKFDFSLITPLENQPKMNTNMLSFTNNVDSVPSQQVCKIEAVDEMYLCDSDHKYFQFLNSKSGYDQKDSQATKLGQGQKRERLPSVDQHHIIAERKRREKLSQRFVTLSAILPGLKKVDKASILEQAIRHVKELKEKVQQLEEQEKTRSEKSVMFVNKSQLEEDDHSSSSSAENNNCSSGDADIEVRFSDKNVLIRITCERRNAFVQNIHNEIEKLHLSIVQSCMMSFGKHAIDVTVVAQMDESFCMTLKDLVKHVRIVTARLMTQA